MTMPTCPACQVVSTDPSAAYCSRCGTAQGAPSAQAGAVRSPSSRWYHNIWFVLAMLLFVLGPFGLPLVWSNPRFSRWVKYALTVAMVVYSIGLIKVTVQMVHAVSQALNQFNSTLSF